ncbi:hypothetical protein [Streptomyces sp. NPDC058457]|uniref:hypothetical protein n=1 Tax=Streptomyces sp. NPDC058457 TaxID=3346507 RepID=UPI0036677F5F
MPKKSDRRVPLPAGLIPLLTQPELETYYDVSDWTVLQWIKWIKEGMPVEPVRSTGTQKAMRRFNVNEVKARHAANRQAAEARFEKQARELHPDADDALIAKVAQNLRKAHFTRMGLASAAKRRKARDAL